MLKWSRKDLHVWTIDMFNCALQHGMPHDWSMNHIKLLHKRGDINILMYNGSEAKSMGKKELQEDFSGKKTNKLCSRFVYVRSI